MNSPDELDAEVPTIRQCTDHSVRSILASTSSSSLSGRQPSLTSSHGYTGEAVRDLEGDFVSERFCTNDDVLPPSSILSELQRTVSDRTSVSLTGRVGAASGTDFILAPVVGAGTTLRPFDILDQRRTSGSDDRAGSGLMDEAEDSRESPTVELEYKPLWDQFATLGTEMVITKSGRSFYCQCFTAVYNLR